MKYIITKNQFLLLSEQPHDDIMIQRGNAVRDVIRDGIAPFCEENPGICLNTSQILVWFVPYVGPYLSGALGIYNTVRLFKEGKDVEAYISLITSPFAISRTLLISKYLKIPFPPQSVEILKKIHNSGIPILYASGVTAFNTWLYHEFLNLLRKKDGDKYKNDPKKYEKDSKKLVDNFYELLKNKNLQKIVISDLKKEITNWKNKNPKEYSLLSSEHKKIVDNLSL